MKSAKGKIKVVWVCNVMNASIREHLHADITFWRWVQIIFFTLVSAFFPIGIRSRLKKYLYYVPQSDYGQWNTNAFKEFENIDIIDLHVIVPVNMTSRLVEEFESKGIHYYIIKSKDSLLHKALGDKLGIPSYKANRRIITSIIDRVSPDIVHVIGAENPQYSQVVFDIYKRYPVIVQLQTLLSDPKLQKAGSKVSPVVEMEKKILSLPITIGTPMQEFKKVLLSVINPDAHIIDIGLAVNEPVERREYEKKYDFVYFSANISKAADLAIAAFCLAAKKHPEITLDVIGAYSEDFKNHLEVVLDERGVKPNVTFEGSLPSHDDVINGIRKARYALLPLKIDMISGTIREACANGLPVVTTITGGTPKLNTVRETALLSAIGDHEALAANMIRLIEDTELAAKLRENGYLYAEGLANNKEIINKWVQAYNTILTCGRTVK